MQKLYTFMKREPVFLISFLAALITCFFVPPSLAYVNYMDLRTLALLYCLMVVVAGFQKAGVFYALANCLCNKAKTLRALGGILVFLCFFSATVITNDVALLTFVPLAIMVFVMANQSKHLLWVVILQIVAANLGSMLTPIGNPQNLYLFSFYNFTFASFFTTVIPVWGVSFIFILALCFLFPKAEIKIIGIKNTTLHKTDVFVYVLLLAVCFLVVFHILPWPVMLLSMVLILFFYNRKILLQADFILLLTFICFFIFSGNLEKIPTINKFIHSVIKGREYMASVALSQVISNVPAALILSEFTDKAKLVLLGVNVGGLGTPIASLASIIGLKLYSRSNEAKTGKFLLFFTIVNFTLLIVLSLLVVFFLQ